MKPFKFFDNKEEYGIITLSAQVGIAPVIDVVSINHTIPPPVEIVICRAIITSRFETFVNFRVDMMRRRPHSQYQYPGSNGRAFIRDNVEYFHVHNQSDALGRLYDNYILLHDAQNIEDLEQIVTYLESRGSTEMF